MSKNKLIGIVLLLVLALAVVGCNRDEAADNGNGYEDFGRIEFAYSDNLDEDGFWEGVNALDYVTLPEYLNLRISAEAHSVSEELIDEQLYHIAHDFAIDEEVYERAVVDRDTVNIDYVGSIDGEEFEGGNTFGMGTEVTIGVTQYIDDFLEQLIGRQPGETFDIEVTFPDDYFNEDLSGKDAVFNTTVNFILEHTHPTIDDDFVRENLQVHYGVSTVAELRAFIKEGMQVTAIESFVNDHLFAESQVSEIPQSMIDYQNNAMLSYYQDHADQYELELADFLEMFVGATSIEELLEMTREENSQIAKYHLLIQAVAEDASIKVEDEDIAQFFLINLGIVDYSEYIDHFGLPYIKLSVLQQVVIDHIKDNAILE